MKTRRPPRPANRGRLPAAYGLSLAAHAAVLVAIGVGVWEAPKLGAPSPHWKAATLPILQFVPWQDDDAPAAAAKEEAAPAIVEPSSPAPKAKRSPHAPAPARDPSSPAGAASPREGAFAPPSLVAESGWPLFCPRPAYPAEARRRGVEGLVKLDLRVSPQGVVESVLVLESSGHPLLDRAALAAVGRWRLQPARIGRERVAANVTLPVRFLLKDDR